MSAVLNCLKNKVKVIITLEEKTHELPLVTTPRVKIRAESPRKNPTYISALISHRFFHFHLEPRQDRDFAAVESNLIHNRK